jgi:hypothetical protein
VGGCAGSLKPGLQCLAQGGPLVCVTAAKTRAIIFVLARRKSHITRMLQRETPWGVLTALWCGSSRPSGIAGGIEHQVLPQIEAHRQQATHRYINVARGGAGHALAIREQ